MCRGREAAVPHMVLDALRRTELRGCKQGSRHAQKALRIIRVSMSSPFLCLMYFAIMDMCDPAPVYALESQGNSALSLASSAPVSVRGPAAITSAAGHGMCCAAGWLISP